MKECRTCGTTNLDHANFCDCCGASLVSKEEPVFGDFQGRGSCEALQTSAAVGMGILRSVSTGIEYRLEMGKEYRIGRGDQSQGIFPEIALQEPLALQQGVSRLHAKIISENGIFYIIDLNSLNSTYINGRKLRPQQAYSLREGDVIELGNYKMLYSRG